MLNIDGRPLNDYEKLVVSGKISVLYRREQRRLEQEFRTQAPSKESKIKSYTKQDIRKILTALEEAIIEVDYIPPDSEIGQWLSMQNESALPKELRGVASEVRDKLWQVLLIFYKLKLWKENNLIIFPLTDEEVNLIA